MTVRHDQSALRTDGRRLMLVGTCLVVLALAVIGVQVGRSVSVLRTRAQDLEALSQAGMLSMETLDQSRSDLLIMQSELAALRWRVQPLLPACPLLGWLPVVGGDVAAVPALLEMTEGLVDGGLLLTEAAQGVTLEGQAGQAAVQLNHTLPTLAAARVRLAGAEAAWDRVDARRLSTRVARLAGRLEDGLAGLQKATDGALLAGRLLGMEEPRRYLVLVQNEDELRATGGFISAAVQVTVDGGQVTSIAFQDSYQVDDLSRPYFPPPAPVRDYMGSDIWLFRDANWSPDFPTAAAKAEELYAYGGGELVDGVIALDGRVVQQLVAAVGPLTIPGGDTPVTGDNLQAYMRASWSPDGGDPNSPGWWEGRKDFMPALSLAMLEKLGTGYDRVDGGKAVQAVLESLEKRHLQLWVHDTLAAAVLADQGWDGQLQVADGDFLMLVDTNVGFNKVNPNIDQTLHYLVDLTDVTAPSAVLEITYVHTDGSESPCLQEARYGADYADMMARCYWDYLRVLAPAGAQLLDASPAPLPEGSLRRTFRGLTGEYDTLRVGQVDRGLTSFEELLLVSGGESRSVRYAYALPAGVVWESRQGHTYRLQVQKQAGTSALPLAVTVKLPSGSRLLGAEPTPAGVHDEQLTFDLSLRTDAHVEVHFR